MPDTQNTQVVKPTTEARQGVTGHHVRTVLAVSLAAIVVLLTAIYLFYFGS